MQKQREDRIKEAIRFLEERYESDWNAFKTHGVYIDDQKHYLEKNVWPYKEVIKLIQDMYKTIKILEQKLEGI